MFDATPAVAPVLFEEWPCASGHRIGLARLNAERSLHALTLPMIRLLDARLQQWAQDPAIACVVLDGAGEKAFCAGGDVRGLRQAQLELPAPVPHPATLAFFSEEYRLDYRIHTYPKPLLVWGHGIVMGGGLGLMVGASHRVVTETSRLAMPEIAIGLFPDVGGSWFLPRLPQRLGLFLALTGASITATDALQAGLADHLLPAATRAACYAALVEQPWQPDVAHNRSVLSALLGSMAAPADASGSLLTQHGETLARWMAGDQLDAIVARVAAWSGDEPRLQRAAAALAAGSPSSLALIWALQQRARGRSLAEVFRMELGVAIQVCARADFSEGVRAVLVDKDHAPRWLPATLAEVSTAQVEACFVEPCWPGGRHPLHDLAD